MVGGYRSFYTASLGGCCHVPHRRLQIRLDEEVGRTE
jgi:hypothetical protein